MYHDNLTNAPDLCDLADERAYLQRKTDTMYKDCMDKIKKARKWAEVEEENKKATNKNKRKKRLTLTEERDYLLFHPTQLDIKEIDEQLDRGKHISIPEIDELRRDRVRIKHIDQLLKDSAAVKGEAFTSMKDLLDSMDRTFNKNKSSAQLELEKTKEELPVNDKSLSLFARFTSLTKA